MLIRICWELLKSVSLVATSHNLWRLGRNRWYNLRFSATPCRLDVSWLARLPPPCECGWSMRLRSCCGCFKRLKGLRSSTSCPQNWKASSRVWANGGPLPARWYICTCPHVLLHQRLNGVNCAEHWSLYINEGRQHCDSWLKMIKVPKTRIRSLMNLHAGEFQHVQKRLQMLVSKSDFHAPDHGFCGFAHFPGKKGASVQACSVFSSPQNLEQVSFMWDTLNVIQCLVLWFNPRNLLPFKMMRTIQVNLASSKQWQPGRVFPCVVGIVAISTLSLLLWQQSLRFAVNTVAICT